MKSRPEPEIESPIPFRTGSNGEFAPRPKTETDRKAEELFFRLVDDRARKLGVSRRRFIESSSGIAAALLVINQVYGCSKESASGPTGPGDSGTAAGSETGPRDSNVDGGRYSVDSEMTLDSGSACERVSGDELIFDVQTHQVNPHGAWRASGQAWSLFLQSLPQARCGRSDRIECFDVQHYLREMFINSDTTMAVLSAVPAVPGQNPLEVEEAAATRAVMDRLSGSERLIIHGLVLPNMGTPQLEGMQRLKEELKIAAWKVYTPFGGWRLDDSRIGIPFIERARELGIKRICAHKGLPIAGLDPRFASPDDIGVVARMFPDVKFIVYHSGYETSVTEGAYTETGRGVDRLIKSLVDNGIGPNQNVYAELGTTWRSVMTRPNEAAHVLGKLLKYVGADRVLWGTDSIWYGTPQDQIVAFRTFEITPAFQEMFGYPALTPALKAKVFGLNAAEAYGVDPSAVRCAIKERDLDGLSLLREEPRAPSFRRYGPQTRREFFAFLRARDGMPG